jgi:hypothetical protein
MHFGENQLSRSLIGLSPLSTAHPLSFQPKWVRSSTTSYRASTWPWIDHSASGLDHATQRPIQTRFRYGSPHGLTSPHSTNSQAHSSKGTPSPHKEAPTDCRHTVSGTISLPSRGTFHLSLTVLVRYRSPGIFRLTGGPARFTRDFSGPVLLGIHLWSCVRFVYGALTLYGRPFQCRSTTHAIFNSCRPVSSRPRGPTTPYMQRLTAITHVRFSLFRFRSPLLTESRLLSLPVGTEMFHFPTFPPPALYIQGGDWTCLRTAGFPHSEILGSKSGYQLPEAYRRFPRPSSVPGAKASTVRP